MAHTANTRRSERVANAACAKLIEDLKDNGLDSINGSPLVQAYTELDIETGYTVLVGAYTYMLNGEVKVAKWEATVDRFFDLDGAYDMFLKYFVNRKDFICADYDMQDRALAENIHPQAYAKWEYFITCRCDHMNCGSECSEA
jgi:hypothetical protein